MLNKYYDRMIFIYVNYKKLIEDILSWLGFIITLIGMLGVARFYR
jgi:multisubunit Na+/H+ antiporter MnhG subunit